MLWFLLLIEFVIDDILSVRSRFTHSSAAIYLFLVNLDQFFLSMFIRTFYGILFADSL